MHSATPEDDFVDGRGPPRGPYLAGDTFTNADCAVIPYILRLELLKLGAMWQREPAVADWWARVRERASVKSTIFERMQTPTGHPSRICHLIRGPRCSTLLKVA